MGGFPSIDLACLRDRCTEKHSTQGKGVLDIPLEMLKPKGYLQILTLLVLFFSFITASSYFYRDSQAESIVSNLTGKHSHEKSRTLFKQYYYRADIAALYSTSALQYYADQRTLPPGDEILDIEVALLTCIRYDYIPLYAFKSYSDLFYIKLDIERSIGILDFAANRYPHQISLQKLLADQLEKAGRWDAAKKVYQLCLNIDPSSFEFHQKLARIYKKTGSEDEFEEEMNILRQLDPRFKME